MKKALRLTILFLGGILPLLFIGCAGTPPARMYRLAALSPPAEVPSSADLFTVRLQNVNVPAVLNQPVVVTRADAVGIHRSEFDRWAEPLEAQTADVLGRNLSAVVPGLEVLRGRLHPGVASDADLYVEVLTFSGVLGEVAELELRWSWRGEGIQSGLHTWRGTRALKLKTLHAYVTAQSELLADAALEIARSLSAAQTNPEGSAELP